MPGLVPGIHASPPRPGSAGEGYPGATAWMAGTSPGHDGSQPRYAARFDSASAFHTASGVAGMSICVTPSSASASTSAFMTAGGEPTAPASPAPFTPIGL